jgi:hypothetical protein
MEEEFEDLVLVDEEEFEAELEQLAYLGGLDSLSFNELADKHQISDAARAEYANSFGYEVQKFVDDGNYISDTQDIYSFPENLSTENPFGVFNNLGSTVLRNLPGILNQVGIRASEMGGGSDEDADGDGIADSIYSGQGGLSASPVSIVQRNEAGEQIGIVQGVRVGYGDNARVVTLDELASINEIRRRSGQDIITTSTPGFVPEIVDESGAPVDNSSNANAVSSTDTSEVGGGGPPRRTDDSGSIINDGGSSGGGMRPIRTPLGTIYVPEIIADNPGQLLTQGYITNEIYNYFTGQDAPDEPVELVQETGDPLRKETMTDAQLNGLDPNFTGEDNGLRYENGMLVSSDGLENTGSLSATGGSSSVGDIDAGDSESSASVGDIDAGDSEASANVGDIDVGDSESSANVGNIDVSSQSGQGGAGGNVSVNIGGGSGLSSGEITEILKTSGIVGLITTLSDRGEITPGQLQDIFPEAVSTIKSGAPKEFSEEVIKLDREISPQQAELATDLYAQVTGAVRDSQNPLVKSLFDRGETLDSSIAQYFDPNLSFLQQRGAEQQGFAEALAFGRPFSQSDERAKRRIQDRKDLNFQLGLQGLGQQQNLAALTSGIEGSIYSQIAPNIGIDPNVLLNVSGTDIGNRLSLIQSTQGAEAIRDSGDKQLAAEFAAPVFGGLLDIGVDYAKDKLNIG